MISSKAGICPTYVKLAIFTPATLSLSRILVRASASKSCGETYAEWKAVASKTGNPGKEWLVGCKQDGSGSSGKLHPSTEALFQGAKKGAEDVTEAAREAKEHMAMRAGQIQANRGASSCSKAN